MKKDAMNNILNKKGMITFSFTMMLIHLIFLVIMLVACVLLISMFLNSKFDFKKTQAEILINSLIYSPGGIGYFDPVTGRNYPTIVNLVQANDYELDEGIFYPDNNLITAKIKITKDTFLSLFPLKELYYNKKWYDNWQPLTSLSSLRGSGGVIDTTVRLPIIVMNDSGYLQNAYVTFEIIQPKSARKSQ